MAVECGRQCGLVASVGTAAYGQNVRPTPTMSFQIPESLLIQLRARREEARRGPANQHTLAKEAVVGKRNFSESLRRLFSGRVSVAAVANDYVQNMDNWQEEIEVAHDACLLDPGMGPMV